jgi:putative membrane protein
MRSAKRVAAVALVLALGVAARGDDKKTDQKPVSDEEFVIKAASGGAFEVESGKLAKDAAQSADVKKFAEKMITDHGKANKQLIGIARKANFGIPVKMLDEHRMLFDTVKGAKGAAFDRAYADAQVKAHEEAVALFSNAAKNARNPDLKAFAEKTLPVIKEHYELAKKLAKGGTDK